MTLNKKRRHDYRKPAPAMKANHILVDFENVPHLSLDRIGEDHVVFTKPHAFYLAFSKAPKEPARENE